MTKQQIEAKKTIKEWCEKNDIEVKSISHIFPRAYILAKLAPKCILVATPFQDAEPQVRDKLYSSFNTIHNFDSSLKTGDWCNVAYVCRSGIQDNVAVPIKEAQDDKTSD